MEGSCYLVSDPQPCLYIREAKASHFKPSSSASFAQARQPLLESSKASPGYVAYGQALLQQTLSSTTTHKNGGLELVGLAGNMCWSVGPQELQNGKRSSFDMQINAGEVELDGDVELPAMETFVLALEKCRKERVLSKARHMHAYMQNHGLESHAAIGSYIVSMFVECGSVSDAVQVFYRLVYRDVNSWTSLMLGYIQNGQMQLVIELYQRMQDDNVGPSSFTHVALLKACAMLKNKEMGQQIHIMISKSGYEASLFVGNALVHMYAKCGSLEEAHSVFNQMGTRDLVSWNTLIAGYADLGPGLEALKCLEHMKMEGVGPDSVSFIGTLKACCSIGIVEGTHKIHGNIVQTGFENDLVVGSTLVDAYAKCGSLAEAWDVFDKLTTRDVVLWNALITGYAEHGHNQEVLDFLYKMQLEGLTPDSVSAILGLKASSSLNDLERGRHLHGEIARKGFERYSAVGNTLVSMYAACGSPEEAKYVLIYLQNKDVVAWSAVIMGYAESGLATKALRCLEEMRAKSIAPNDVTFVCSLKACSSIEALEEGQRLHIELTQQGLDKDPVVGITLVDLYAKCALLAEAQYIFDGLPVHDVVSQTALMAGYAEHGPFQEVLKLYKGMQLEGVSPNSCTFVCVVKACSNMGALHKGYEMHMEIVKRGHEIDLCVGNILVDMYGRCGSLAESLDVFNELPIQDVVAWSALIKGFGMNHQVELALHYFMHMQEQGLKPDAATMSCVLSACSRSNLVHDGQKVFKAMRNEYGVTPNIDHYTCMIDLLARAGHLLEAERLLEFMPDPADEESWTALLTACKMYGEVELGHKCFQQLVCLNPISSVPYLLMSDIYAKAGRVDDRFHIEEMRKQMNARKKPAVALIEIDERVHEFTVGSNQSKEITTMLETLYVQLKNEGHELNLNVRSGCIPDEERETSLCEHAERLAIAFGFLNTPQGQTLRVTKNLRMCDDCHRTIKMMSKIEKREIIVRDAYCVHHFKENLCSCGDQG